MQEGPVGVLLAAGAGRRAGGPKALRRDPDGTAWLARSLATLAEGGCGRLVLVLGAAAEQAEPLVPDDLAERTRVVRAEEWSTGMAASLGTGLHAAAELITDRHPAVCLHLVDLPDVGPAVVRRVLAAATGAGSLARADFAAGPGHPVLIGRDHLLPIATSLRGDTGARAYLAAHGCTRIDCRDLATGRDVDHAADGTRAAEETRTAEETR